MQPENRLRGIREAGKARTIVVALLLFGAAVAIYLFSARSHNHTFHNDDASFAERLVEPASFIYGSSIHVWAYQKQQGDTVQVFVTGHADGETCREMTGLVFNAYLQKGDDPSDLFVAGAARLSAPEDSTNNNDPGLARYTELLRKYNWDKGMLSVVNKIAIEGSNDKSAVEQLQRQVDEDEKNLKGAESDPTVAKYASSAKSRTAMGSFIREAGNIAQDSGLVQVHILPSELGDEARQRILNAVKPNAPSITRFDDLLASHHVPEAVVLTDMFRKDSGQPLEIRIPLNDLSVDGFEEAKKLNRSEVESSMVGDADRRKHFYEDQQSKIQRELDECRQASPKEREKNIILGETCSPDGFCYPSDNKERTTYGEYCDKRIPKNLQIVKSWIGGVETLLKNIQEDRGRTSDSRIEAINHATLIDSMLRNWTLPVARSQEAFDFWREKRRGSAWSAIDTEVRKAGIQPDVLNGEEMVFSVRVSGQELVIRPVLIVDLARSVLIADRKSGVVRVVDAWGKRAPARTQQQKENRDNAARELALNAIDHAKKGDFNNGQNLIVSALATQPATALRTIEAGWNSLFADDTKLRAQLLPKARGMAMRQERLAVIDELFNSPDLKDDPKKFDQRLARALEADPGLPVDLHMRLATDVSGEISEISHLLVSKGAPGTAYTPWQIVQMAGSASGLHSASIPSSQLLDKAADVFQQVYDVEPDKVLKESVSIIQQRAPQYMESARKLRGMPKELSPEMQALVKADEVGMLDWETAELDGVQGELTRRLHADKAAEMLWSSGDPDLGAVQRELNEAKSEDSSATTPAFKAASDRLAEFVKSKNKPDTLARVEIGQIISGGSKELLLRAAQRMKNPKTQYTAALSTHPKLQARISFEENRYALAYDTLLSESVPVALYYPQQTWVATHSDWSGRADKLMAECSQTTVLLRAKKEAKEDEVLRISGLPSQECTNLAQQINQHWSPAPIGHVSEQVLATQVPLREEAQNVRRLLTDSKVRLALLKAMVFGDVPPADDLVPGLHSALRVDEKAVANYQIPTLDEVVENAKKEIQ